MSLHTIPIAQRPPHGPISSRIFFPLLFTLAQLGLIFAQVVALPLLLIPFVGRSAFKNVIDYTKDGYGRLLILITVLFGPTTLKLTTSSPELANLVETDSYGNMTRLNLPERMILMANHQAYLDWMYMWILACYSGNSKGVVILLKASLRKIPGLGWAMANFRFIFMDRSWATDQKRLSKALAELGREAHSADQRESSSLLAKARSSLWLLIFPEGTITSDEERAKSVRYAEREGIDDLVTMLHPRSTGLLFCLRSLLPHVPDLKLLDATIGYPGVPYGKYPQDYYGLFSVFLRSVPPPTVHIHLQLYSNLTSPDCPIPSLTQKESDQAVDKEEARAFELWIRKVWQDKEKRMESFYREQRFDGTVETVPIRQLRWTDNIAAFGAGGLAVVAVALTWLARS